LVIHSAVSRRLRIFQQIRLHNTDEANINPV